MTFLRNPHRRRAAAALSGTAAVASAGMFALTAWSVAIAASSPAAAAGVAGQATVQSTPGPGQPALTSGASDTAFYLELPANAACSGDANAAPTPYVVTSYIVPGSVDPGSLKFNGKGPSPSGTGASLAKPLYQATGGNPLTSYAPDPAIPPSTQGIISNLPAFNFAVWGTQLPTIVPAGTYNVGIACIKGIDPTATDQLDKYWNVRLTFAANGSDPNGASWTVAADPGTTTTTSTTATTTSTSSTDTTATTAPTDSTTSTTAPGGSTSTTGGVSGGGVSGGGFTGGGPSAASPVSPIGQLPYTGSSPLPMVLWGVLLVVLGRIAVLLGRPVKVRPGTSG